MSLLHLELGCPWPWLSFGSLGRLQFMENQTPPPLEPVTQPPQQSGGVSVGTIIRDVVIVVVLTGIGGFVIGLSGGLRSSTGMIALAVSNLLLGTIGFIISGCLARENRWRHLWIVALGVWIFGIVNIVFFGFSIGQWIASAFAIALMTGAGGGLSYVFRRNDAPSA
jgi:hypothetical protein